MADLKTFVKNVMDEQMKEKYPHMILPATAIAKITKAEQTEAGYQYSLKLLDKNLSEDETIPEIPNVISSGTYVEGDTVAVILLYGLILPYIIGRYAT